jgi:phospholipase C
MSYDILRACAGFGGRSRVTITNNWAKASYSASGRFPVLYPGKLQLYSSAKYLVSIKAVLPGPEQTDSGSEWRTATKTFNLKVTYTTPDGQPFTGTTVTLADLAKYRDLRGVTQGEWGYEVKGETDPIPFEEGLTRVTADKVRGTINILETVKSKSAAGLVNDIVQQDSIKTYRFDLYRVGTFIATASNYTNFRLLDPDGVAVANGSNKLTYPVSLRTLNKSRGAGNTVRQWTLEAVVNVPSGAGHSATLNATVIQSWTLKTAVLQDRIDTLIGTNGSKISIYGAEIESYVAGQLVINDTVSAETIDMHGLLDSIIGSQPQFGRAEEVVPDIVAGVPYTIGSHLANLGHGLRLNTTVKVDRFSLVFGNSVKIQPVVPALRFSTKISGQFSVSFEGISLGSVKVRNSVIDLEIGLALQPNGEFALKTWITPTPLDVDISLGPLIAAGIITGGLIALGIGFVTEYLESEVNKLIQKGIQQFANGLASKIPPLLTMIHGAHFTYRSLTVNNNNFVFEYVAPLEHEPKPSPNFHGAIGRQQIMTPGGGPRFIPLTLGDTWKADNLSKIDHVVVVMMENRSYDHVLGYRATAAPAEGSNGLDLALTSLLAAQQFPVVQLRNSAIHPNSAGLKTKFSASVGHGFTDVAEQLSEILTGPDGQAINSPAGFMSNFSSRLVGHEDELRLSDVLGYYTGSDLPFFKYLADNYSYCDRFFCSHPGPTLPNRMYSLTGDLQHDRTGETIIENYPDDNFILSRATTIYDLLSRKGISWRVYESQPSVTMLRMFARYAADNSNIVDIGRLSSDIAAGNLPALTIVDPAMHHYPENDDHSPDADMYDGQVFLKGVYDALRSNPTIWRKTLFIITYDEHGGFYDHVPPPVADVLTAGIDTPPIVSATPAPSTPPVATGDTADAVLKSLSVSYGVRVPTFLVSPYVPAGKGPDMVLDFCSILKTILARFCPDKPFISDRVAASQSFNSFLTETTPRMNIAASPTLPPLVRTEDMDRTAIKTSLVSRKEMRAGNVDYHELTGMLGRMLGRK